VIEFGGSRGLEEAQVMLERWDGPAVSSFMKRTEAGRVKTDVAGSFVFDLDQPGTYRLTVARMGTLNPAAPVGIGRAPTSRSRPEDRLGMCASRWRGRVKSQEASLMRKRKSQSAVCR
jgi:hypothetical protein